VSTSTKPYLLRALYDWCVDNGHTPYLAVRVDDQTQVPREYVKDGEIVLNIGADATNKLTLGNEWVEFQARFGGVARQCVIPIHAVSGLFARETGEGMGFPVEAPQDESAPPDSPSSEPADTPPKGRPSLKVVK
jgi:stringent starvation protein B